jgi:hypothetical protein
MALTPWLQIAVPVATKFSKTTLIITTTKMAEANPPVLSSRSPVKFSLLPPWQGGHRWLSLAATFQKKAHHHHGKPEALQGGDPHGTNLSIGNANHWEQNCFLCCCHPLGNFWPSR